MLAETFVAISAMIQIESGAAFPDPDFFLLAIPSAIIAFSLWGVYFTDEDHLASDELGHALLWGYGHFALFAAGAAAGAGMTVMLSVLDHSAHVDPRVGVLAIAVPVAIYLATLWLIRDRLCLYGVGRWLLLGSAALVLLIGFIAPRALELTAVLLVATALSRRGLSRAETESAP